MVNCVRWQKVSGFRRVGRGWTLLLLVSLGLALCLGARAANFTVTVDRDTISVGETATLTMSFEGGSPSAMPTLPSIPNLRIQDENSESTSISVVNGEVTSVASHSFALTPTQSGTYIIPSMVVNIGGQEARSQPVRLSVGNAEKPTADPRTTFLKLVVSKTDVYLGEILPVEIQLYFQAIQGAEMPHLNEQGFTLGKMLQPTQSSTVLNGIQYNVATLRTFVVPAKVGHLDLGPATMSMNVPKPNSRRNFFGQLVDWQPVTLESNPLTLNVQPLPQNNVPASFTGAVGAFTLSDTVNPTNVSVGDPITVKVQIAGHGALEGISLPTQNWPQFKLYPPTSEFQPSDQLGVGGTRTFSLTAVPQSLDVKELPPFQFSYFDPNQREYHTLTQSAVPLIVRPSAASLPAPALAAANNNSADATSARKDISPIKLHLGALAQIRTPLVEQTWFCILQSVPVLAWMTLLVRRKQKENLANNPRLRRQREVAETVRSGLAKLREHANAGQSVEFFALMFHLLQEQLGERLDLPASAITEAVLDEQLRNKPVSEEELALLRELFQTCNQARYARESTNAELVSLISKLEKALNDLKKLPA